MPFLGFGLRGAFREGPFGRIGVALRGMLGMQKATSSRAIGNPNISAESVMQEIAHAANPAPSRLALRRPERAANVLSHIRDAESAILQRRARLELASARQAAWFQGYRNDPKIAQAFKYEQARLANLGAFRATSHRVGPYAIHDITYKYNNFWDAASHLNSIRKADNYRHYWGYAPAYNSPNLSTVSDFSTDDFINAINGRGSPRIDRLAGASTIRQRYAVDLRTGEPVTLRRDDFFGIRAPWAWRGNKARGI